MDNLIDYLSNNVPKDNKNKKRQVLEGVEHSGVVVHNVNEAYKLFKSDDSFGDHYYSEASDLVWEEMFRGIPKGKVPMLKAKKSLTEYLMKVESKYNDLLSNDVYDIIKTRRL
jgi:hypothetical protein